MTPQQIAHNARAGRLRSLLKNWSLTAQKKDMLHGKSAELGPTEGLKPFLLQKLSRWVEQITVLQNKENDIISEITAIEQKHNELRKKKKLRRVIAAPEEEPVTQKKKDRFWFWFILLVLFMKRNKPAPAPQNG
jgi:hypothetical protein